MPSLITNTSLPHPQTPLPQQTASADCMPERKTKQLRLEEKYHLQVHFVFTLLFPNSNKTSGVLFCFLFFFFCRVGEGIKDEERWGLLKDLDDDLESCHKIIPLGLSALIL